MSYKCKLVLCKAAHAIDVGNILHEITVSCNLVVLRYSSLEVGKYVAAKLSFACGENLIRENIIFMNTYFLSKVPDL